MRDHLRVRSSSCLPTLIEKNIYKRKHKEKDHNTYIKDKTNVILYWLIECVLKDVSTSDVENR